MKTAPSNREQSSLVLSADFPCMYLLAEALARQRGATTVVRLFDFPTYWRVKPRWAASSAARLRREVWLFPPGYGGKFERLCRSWVAARVARAVRRLAAGSAGADRPWVIAPFPYLAGALRSLPPCRLVYYNLDDYSTYPKGWSPRVAALEDELIERSSLVVCAAWHQVEKFRRRFPHKRVEHLPLAVPEEALNHQPGPPAADAFDVGYVGTLNDRVDWRLCAEVAARCPEMRFTFVGPLHDASPQGGTRADWLEERGRVLALPNVRYVPPVPHAEVAKFYREFAVSWIPYDTSHAFNVASCPTKIMDGLASGRPVLGTDLPECERYPEWVTVATDANTAVGSFAAAARRALGRPGKGPRRASGGLRRHAPWARRVADLAAWLEPSATVPAEPALSSSRA